MYRSLKDKKTMTCMLPFTSYKMCNIHIVKKYPFF